MTKPLIIRGEPSYNMTSAATMLENNWYGFTVNSLRALIEQAVQRWRANGWRCRTQRDVTVIFRSDDRGNRVDTTRVVPFADLGSGICLSPSGLLYSDTQGGGLTEISLIELLDNPAWVHVVRRLSYFSEIREAL